MIALRSFFHALEIVVEFRLRLEHDAVDALQHRALLVAAPVRARDAGELERRHLRRAVDVRAFAEIEERALLVQRHLLVGDAFDQLDLERLPGELRQRLGLRHRAVLEADVGRDALPHARLDVR